MSDLFAAAQTCAVHEAKLVPISKLTPHPEHYVVHPEEQLAQIGALIRMHGVYRNVVVARDGTILAGHAVVQAATAEMHQTIPAVRLDIAPDSQEAYRILVADNRKLGERDTNRLAEILYAIGETDGEEDVRFWRTEMVRPTRLKRHSGHYVRQTPEQHEHLMRSIREHGFYRNVVIGWDDTLLVGHAVAAAAEAVGLDAIPAVKLDVDPDSPEGLRILTGDNELVNLAEDDPRQQAELLKKGIGANSKALLGSGYSEEQATALLMASRPATEISDKNAALEWFGLPAFTEKLHLRVMVSFETEDERQKFMDLIGRPTIRTRQHNVYSMWWPDRPREDLASLRFEFAEDGTASLPFRTTKYPVYIPTKGRATKTLALTIRTLQKDRVPFYAVVEPQDVEDYERLLHGYPGELLVLPFSNLGLGSIPARNWIMEHSIEHGHARHWQLDDNMRDFRRLYRGRRIPCHPVLALRVCEEMTDRYENVGISGLAYQMFALPYTSPPFRLNCHVYSCTLVNNEIRSRYRGRYNEDTDICLQVLSDGWCTVQVNAFMCDKMPTMTMKGGNTDHLYQAGEMATGRQDSGRLRMTQDLVDAWPGVVTLDRRYKRQAHVVDWSRFDTKLRRKPGIVPEAFPEVDEFGCILRAVKPVKSPVLRRLLEEFEGSRARTQATDALDATDGERTGAPVPSVVVGDEMYPLLLADGAQAGHLTPAEFDHRYRLHKLVERSREDATARLF